MQQRRTAENEDESDCGCRGGSVRIGCLRSGAYPVGEGARAGEGETGEGTDARGNRAEPRKGGGVKGWALEGLEAVKANLDRFGLCPSEAVRKQLAGEALAEGRAAAKESCGVVMLVDGAEDAPLMTVYPEERLALVNMTALLKGVGGSGVRQDRVEKLAWRAIGHLVGCGAPDGYTCVMKPVRNMAELDAMPNKFIHPATFFKARPYFDMCGVTPARKGTYESACQQGWAPPPTNDVQKAIWDKVHAVPATPMKIEFDPKKGR